MRTQSKQPDVILCKGMTLFIRRIGVSYAETYMVVYVGDYTIINIDREPGHWFCGLYTTLHELQQFLDKTEGYEWEPVGGFK